MGAEHYADRRSRRTVPNQYRMWDAIWERDQVGMVEEHGVSHLMDDVKFSYLAPHLPAAGMIVEFGCGTARLLRFAAGRGLKPLGIDFSTRALQLARRTYLASACDVPLTLIRADVSCVPLRSESTDAVASTGLLEHFANPVPCIREMVRLLKPGGLFYSDIVPAKFSLFRSLDWLRTRQVEVFERGFRREEVVELLSEAGLREIRVFGAGVFPPRLPLLERHGVVRQIITKCVAWTLPLWRAFDGTSVATLAGFYFFAIGRKPIHPSSPL